MTVSVGSCPAERDARLRVGFVGAGKIGFALGTHLFEHGSKVSGYASRTQKAALWASQCTHSVSFSSLQALLDSTDLIFITVPDGAIAETAGQLADAAASTPVGGLSGKLVCHASGALTSGELDACRKAGAACASVHPLCAVPDVPTSADAPDRLAGMFFTLEGDRAAVDAAGALLDAAGNPHCTIAADAKVRYHAAAVFLSNLSVRPCLRGAGHPGGLRVHARASPAGSRPAVHRQLRRHLTKKARKTPCPALSSATTLKRCASIWPHWTGKRAKRTPRCRFPFATWPHGATPSAITALMRNLLESAQTRK